MDGGYVKEHRSVMEHAVFQDDWLYRLFRWCIMKANFTPGTFKGVVVPVGSFVTGKIRGSEELGVTASKFHRGIHRLTEPPYEVITVDANRDWTMISVCNYKTYQSSICDSEPQVDRQRTASEPPAKPIEELKKLRTQETKSNTAQPLLVFVDLPPSLDVPEFRSVWQLWEQHRKEKREKLTPTATKQALSKLATWGLERSIAAIKHSIGQGWTGIYEESRNGQRTLNIGPGQKHDDGKPVQDGIL
jgi:hypothetical protein